MVLSTREWLILIGLVALDQITKAIVFVTKPANGIFETVWNTGAGFGVLQNDNAWLLALGLVVLAIVFYALHTARTHERVALVMLAAGIIGNVTDRIAHGAVLDFISVGSFPVFNVADSLITLAIVYLLAKTMRESYASWQYRRGKKAVQGKAVKKKK